MGTLGFILFAAAIIFLVIRQAGSRQAGQNRVCRKAAEELRLGYRAGGWMGTPRVAGYLDRLEVRGELDDKAEARLSVSGARIDPELEVTPSPEGSRRVRTGDPDLDAEGVYLLGEPDRTLALLTPEVRATLRECVGYGVRVVDGRVEFRGEAIWDGAGFAQQIRKLVRLAHALEPAEGEVAARLLRRAESDPVPTFRARCWEVLGRLGEPRALPALLTLVDDPRPAVQTAARRALDALQGAPGGLSLSEQPAEAGAVSMPPAAPKTRAD